MPRKPRRNAKGKSKPTRLAAPTVNLADLLTSEVARSEAEVFAELLELCSMPGYVHALAFLIYRDNVVMFGEEITRDDFASIYNPNRLIRKEITVLLGQWLKTDKSLEHPGSKAIQEMIERSDRLMAELHATMLAPAHSDFMSALQARESDTATENPLGKAAAMREAIFYASESAFTYQYIDFARERYASDEEWMYENKGFRLDEATTFVAELIDWLSNSIPEKLAQVRQTNPEEWSMLDIFCFTMEDAEQFSSLDPKLIELIIGVFSAPEQSGNDLYVDPFSQNEAAIFPFTQLNDGRVAFFLEYVGCEALYVSPSFWMRRDKEYAPVAAQNRGDFAEEQTLKFLRRTFPEERILKNVIFRKNKSAVSGELDVLLVHGSRAFFFQVKSKGLTEASRGGDDGQLTRDFKLAVQSAYDQAIKCAQLAKQRAPMEIGGEPISPDIFDGVDEFYPVCVTSENYPSLSFQVAQFLEPESRPGLMPPIVFDLFTIDVATEFLRTPLYFVDYLQKRSKLFDKVFASHELNILGMHLSNNLFVESDINLVMVQDDFVMPIDMALGVRRRQLPGSDTPRGLLTRDLDNPLGRILVASDKSERSEVHQLGELILSLSGEACKTANRWIDRAIRDSRRDGGQHDVTIPISEEGVGLTVHCNYLEESEAYSKLSAHCALRKYVHRSDKWFGVAIEPDSGEIRFAYGSIGAWVFDQNLDREAKQLKVRSAPRWVGATGRLRGKVGRNEPCPCGSGKKYKRCCLD